MGDPPDIEALAACAASVAAEWGVELGAPFALSRFSFVAPAGEDRVLKVTSPDDDESDEEADALALWEGDGAVRLIRHDREARALLLERARPGTDLSGVDDEEALRVVCGLGPRLWRPAAAPFRRVDDHVPRWLDRAEHEGAPGCELIPLARRLFAELDVRHDTLVHGDLHHHNVLDAGGRPVAIDPKPMLGEPEFDVPAFLRNPLGTRIRAEDAERRIAAFAAAGLDEGRIRAWTVIRCAYLGVEPDEVDAVRGLVRVRAGLRRGG